MVWAHHTWQTTPAQYAAEHMLLSALPSSKYPAASICQCNAMPIIARFQTQNLNLKCKLWLAPQPLEAVHCAAQLVVLV